MILIHMKNVMKDVGHVMVMEQTQKICVLYVNILLKMENLIIRLIFIGMMLIKEIVIMIMKNQIIHI